MNQKKPFSARIKCHGKLAIFLCFIVVGFAAYYVEHDEFQKQKILQNQPEQNFDYYVLALSWSPSFCASDRAKNTSLQCDREEPLGLIVHGLWPQFTQNGWPEFCDTHHDLSQKTANMMLDLIPDRNLIRHQWRKHGSCSGLSAEAYFHLTRKAHAEVNVPQQFQTKTTTQTIKTVKAEFLHANPNLKPSMINFHCRNQRLYDIRICLTKKLRFKECQFKGRNLCNSYDAL